MNEIFYSLQGEGRNTGRAAVFVRLAGCNLCCPFCDTQHQSFTPMTEAQIVEQVKVYPASLVVITGGEPALQLTASLVDQLHNTGKTVAIETNGTCSLPDNIDWVTVSPKEAFTGPSGKVILSKAHEVKIVFDGKHSPEEQASGIAAAFYYLQPCDTGDAERNRHIVSQCVEYIKQHPKWTLSLQTHKLLNIP